MTVKLARAAAGLMTVASSHLLVAALVPTVAAVVAVEVAYVARRLRRPTYRSSRHVFGA
jgi:hypothetical protein